MRPQNPMLYEADTEAQVVAAVRAYLGRLPPPALSAFPAGSARAVATADDVAELALVLARERSGRFGSISAAMTLGPVEAFLSRACVRLAQLQSREPAPARQEA